MNDNEAETENVVFVMAKMLFVLIIRSPVAFTVIYEIADGKHAQHILRFVYTKRKQKIIK